MKKIKAPKSDGSGNAECLLREQRVLLWRTLALEAVPTAAPRALEACKERTQIIQTLVESLRNGKALGDRLYWVIHFTYMTVKKPSCINEILESIAKQHGRIPRSSYFRLRAQAIKMLDANLERMVKDGNTILEKLTPCA